MRIGLPIGADVPMCVYGKPLIARGIGEEIEPVDLPEMPILLVNPGVAVSTPAIFKALVKKENGALPLFRPALQNGRIDILPLVDFLKTTRNDLEAAARALSPAIDDVLASLVNSGALFARMSGSGATCFGIFADADALENAKALVATLHPEWWVA